MKQSNEVDRTKGRLAAMKYLADHNKNLGLELTPNGVILFKKTTQYFDDRYSLDAKEIVHEVRWSERVTVTEFRRNK